MLVSLKFIQSKFPLKPVAELKLIFPHLTHALISNSSHEPRDETPKLMPEGAAGVERWLSCLNMGHRDPVALGTTYVLPIEPWEGLARRTRLHRAR